ncbi:GntR family transcriptional regulator [Roseobacter denitrificans]|uniref:Putative transcriptional regulator n=1 Tax=Roseobacter denitrificans (strain ATCC 33942 / OCh 114) TaxID=375451 RepID=Q16C66_ROSDO|nr:GntR family transcriptional regulator [Roseobacter denitrificans]ABG30427.1 putative transcriptional regulator [Roseobacter denitrificans OCh 114]AVL53581.1 GntR family transcriptional regulator [Roseobacter denitrificans]SFF72592.1 transcriptional regulator, GntR family [Roseobacter denitrificans OCh 114]
MSNSSENRARDHAYSSFTQKLLSQDIAPGQIVSQRELVELTGMPLGAIREMIPRLEADGLIKTVPKRGLQVLNIDLDLVRNAFQLRRMIEGEAIALFCAQASTAQIAQIATDHRTIRAQAVGGLPEDLLAEAQKMDWAFHDLVVDAMGNQIISDIYRVNAIKIRLIRNSDTRMLPELAVSVMDEHLAVVDALLARDTEAAVTAMHAHIDSAKRRALGV